MDTASDPLIPQSHGPVPHDRFRVVYFIFYLLGLGSLCPWNFFITASEYFKYKLRNTTLPEGTDYLKPEHETHLQVEFESYLTIASTVPNLLFNFITALLIKRIPLKVRMTSSLCITIVMFALTTVLAMLNTDTWQVPFLVSTLVTVVVVNASSSVLCASIFGLSSLFPSKYIQAAMSGQAMGGVFASIANIISLAAGSHVTDSGLGFFIAATLTAILTLVAYILLYYINFSRYHIIEIGKTLAVNGAVEDYSDGEDVIVSQQHHHGLSYYCRIMKKIWPEGLSVCLVFFVTLSCFPAVASAIVSVSKGNGDWTEKYFSAFVCFLLFNCGDWAGRSVAGWVQLPRFKQTCLLVTLALLRVVFIPLLMYCNAQPRTTKIVFDHDAYPVIFILLLGITNGHLSTLCMMYGPRKAVGGEAESTGAVMSVCLTLGLVGGSLFSLVLVNFM